MSSERPAPHGKPTIQSNALAPARPARTDSVAGNFGPARTNPLVCGLYLLRGAGRGLSQGTPVLAAVGGYDAGFFVFAGRASV